KFSLRVPSCSSWLVKRSRSEGTTARAYRQHGHPAVSPTLRLRVKSVLPFRSTPSSNSVDRKFRAPLLAPLAKSKSQECAEIQLHHKEPHPVPPSQLWILRAPMVRDSR